MAHSHVRNWKDEFIYANRKSFLPEVLHWRFLVTAIVLQIFSSWFGHFWILQYAGLASMDVFATSQPSRIAERSVVVSIGDQEYEDYFDGRSPLEPERLANVISSILRLQPAVLAVDIDTSHPQFRLMAIPETNIPIVWARGAREADGELNPQAVLGNRDMDPPYSGLAVLPYSLDWTVRTYPRIYRLGTKDWPSFHWAIVTTYCTATSDPDCRPRAVAGEDYGQLSVLTFHNRYRIPIIPLSDVLAAESASPENNPFRDKIVLLGGYYSSSDEHPTPFGPIAGVELIATAVETEFSDEQQMQMQTVTKYVFEFALGVLIAWFHHTLRPRYALLATIFFLGSIIVSGSYIAFRVSAYRADFLPFLMGIWIEQQYESTERAHHQSQQRSDTSANRAATPTGRQGRKRTKKET